MSHKTMMKGELWTAPAGGPLTLSGVSGKGWATSEGDSRDFVLRRGATYEFPAEAQVVVLALEDLEFDYRA